MTNCDTICMQLTMVPNIIEHLPLDLKWEMVSDRVMGGVSDGALSLNIQEGEAVATLTGRVSLDNNGGFVQIAADLRPDGSVLDARAYSGLYVRLRGNNQRYDMRLRTTALSRPWQSFRTDVEVTAHWATFALPFSSFQPHRTEAEFDPAGLRRIGILAIGRAFEADVAVSKIGFYSDR